MKTRDRNELIRVLQEARKLIECYEEYYICNAIGLVDANERYKEILKHWIEEQLCGAASYGSWLYERNFNNMNGVAHFGRLQWIDAMIKELQK